MKNSKNRLIQIIRFYWLVKKRNYENSQQANSALKRDLTPAKKLKGYSDKQIQDTMKWLEENFSEGVKRWVLETVSKYIDDNKNKKERRILQ